MMKYSFPHILTYPVLHLHQTFKFKVIANLPKEDGFNLTIDQVSEAIENIVENKSREKHLTTL